MRVPLNLIFGSFFLFLMIFLMISCNVAAYQTKLAWEQYDLAVRELEDSHFDADVMEKACKDSRKSGYQLDIVRDRVYSDTKRYLVKLTYKIRIPILQWEKEREISGYAI